MLFTFGLQDLGVSFFCLSSTIECMFSSWLRLLWQALLLLYHIPAAFAGSIHLSAVHLHDRHHNQPRRIGSGWQDCSCHPSHTTRHAAPHRAAPARLVRRPACPFLLVWAGRRSAVGSRSLSVQALLVPSGSGCSGRSAPDSRTAAEAERQTTGRLPHRGEGAGGH